MVGSVRNPKPAVKYAWTSTARVPEVFNSRMWRKRSLCWPDILLSRANDWLKITASSPRVPRDVARDCRKRQLCTVYYPNVLWCRFYCYKCPGNLQAAISCQKLIPKLFKPLSVLSPSLYSPSLFLSVSPPFLCPPISKRVCVEQFAFNILLQWDITLPLYKS